MGGGGICIPPFLHDSEMSLETTEGRGGDHNSDPSMADTSLLPTPPTNGNSKSNTLAPTEGLTNVNGRGDTSLDRDRLTEIGGVENFRKSHESKGVSKQASELLVASWRDSTKSAYNSCWKHWASWCNEQQIDPFCAPVENIANFLSSLFEKGYEYRTVNSYRSSISAFHSEVNGQKVGQLPLIKQIMKGVFNSRPPMPRYEETWDVNVILKHLESKGENKDLSLKSLSYKTIMLVALTSASRVSELQKIDLKYMKCSQEEITFTIAELTKTRKVGNDPIKMNFPKLEIGLLDVYHSIVEYIHRTEPLRGQEGKLFISFTKPHKAVKTCTLARWIRMTIEEAGIDSSIFKAHSTRGACTSKANKFGLSMAQIMSKANWKSAKTFNRFYNKPIQSEESKFAKTVLSLTENDN